MENMRQSIGLQAIGQRDPLVQYRTMSFQMFTEMNEEIRNEVARTIFHLAPNLPQPSSQLSNASSTPLKADALAAAQRIALAQAGQQSIMSAANAPQQGISGRTVASVNAPTHTADGRRLSRRERRAIERKNKKAQRSKAGG
jgi:preprotein translocase subunit SecA